MSSEQALYVDNDDVDYQPELADDSDDSSVDTMSNDELINLYKDQSINVHELLGSSDDDTDEDEKEGKIDDKELVGLYKDQLVSIEELVSVCSSHCSQPSHKSIFSSGKVSLESYIIKFAAPIAVTLAYIEPISRQNHPDTPCVNMNTTMVLILKAVCLVLLLCAPIMMINYRYKRKIDAFVHDIIVQLQIQRELHVKYPHVYPSAAIPSTQIRSSIISATELSTVQDWRCVLEKLDAHPLLGKSMQEEGGDFIEYWEMFV
ncbi:unnamed protein product [Mucor circinelloides]